MRGIFRVMYQLLGRPLDPPLRSRFQSRLVLPVTVSAGALLGTTRDEV